MTTGRKLIIGFFKLGPISRYEAAHKAELGKEMDDPTRTGMDKWAFVFKEAKKQNKLGPLWDAVASYKDSELQRTPNPYCRLCNGTGRMDSGGSAPWGEPLMVECECCGP